MKIPLSQGKFAIVDDDDFEKLNLHKWCAHRNPSGQFYAVRNIQIGLHRKTIFMHREIMNAPPEFMVDHINRDSLDNRKSNLRKCTDEDNKHNSGKNRDNQSGFKGVSWNSYRRKWVAFIGNKGINHFLGAFNSKEDAARAYDKAARFYHGEFANPNFK